MFVGPPQMSQGFKFWREDFKIGGGRKMINSTVLA